jgi:hypothetical protein
MTLLISLLVTFLCNEPRGLERASTPDAHVIPDAYTQICLLKKGMPAEQVIKILRLERYDWLCTVTCGEWKIEGYRSRWDGHTITLRYDTDPQTNSWRLFSAKIE